METMIDKNGLVNLLDNYNKHTFVSLETETIPELRRKKVFKETIGVEVDNVRKVSQFVAMIGLDYANVIKNRLTKEGKSFEEYKSGSTWHSPVEGTRNLRKHKNGEDLYVWIFLVANNKPVSAFYNMENGKMIDKEEIKSFLPKKSVPTNQGLTNGNEVNPRIFKLESIRKITIEKETYSIK